MFFVSAWTTRRNGGSATESPQPHFLPSAPFSIRKKRVNYFTILQKLHIHGSARMAGNTPVMPSYYTVLCMDFPVED